MSKTISFELQDEVYIALQQISAKTGQSFEELAIEWLARMKPQQHDVRPTVESRTARVELLRRAGNVSSGDSESASNESIDRDLTHETGAHGGGPSNAA